MTLQERLPQYPSETRIAFIFPHGEDFYDIAELWALIAEKSVENHDKAPTDVVD